MMMALICRFPFWPVSPVIGSGALAVLLGVAGIVLSVIMLIDCLKRPASKFYYPITKEAEYDRLVWAGAIVLSLGFYFIGAIVYFFVVKRAKPETNKQAQPTTTSTSEANQKPEGQSQKESE
ncbi:MAG: PLDc_N domain-containing protein [Planctomycetes bacterium]|nr:PLDc_N domain-containing protein [Planctomycetota bacterium]